MTPGQVVHKGQALVKLDPRPFDIAVREAEAALEQTMMTYRDYVVPDSISTDIGRAPDGGPASVLVPMSEFLHLGLPLEQVIAGVTTTPAKMLNYPEKVGALQPGVTADVAILELAQGSFEYRDGARQPRTLKQQFVSVATVKGGIFLKGAPGAAVPPR